MPRLRKRNLRGDFESISIKFTSHLHFQDFESRQHVKVRNWLQRQSSYLTSCMHRETSGTLMYLVNLTPDRIQGSRHFPPEWIYASFSRTSEDTRRSYYLPFVRAGRLAYTYRGLTGVKCMPISLRGWVYRRHANPCQINTQKSRIRG